MKRNKQFYEKEYQKSTGTTKIEKHGATATNQVERSTYWNKMKLK